MKIDFKDLQAPVEHALSPPLKKTVLEGRELEEVHKRMRKWLRERACETFFRASGGCLCPVCGEQYRKHPTVVGAEWLNRLCNGEYVKL